MPVRTLPSTVILLISLLSLAACTTVPGPDAESTGGEQLETTTAGDEAAAAGDPASTTAEPLPPSANPAVIALLDNAHSDAEAGKLQTATAALERAIRIEPKNPVLWHELALLKLKKGEYQQAENFAARSNSWARSNRPLQARNWHIISQARSLRGDNEGAKAALNRAKALEGSD